MNDMVEKKKCKNLFNKIKLMIEIIILLVIIILVMYQYFPKPKKVMYCHFEKNVNDELPRYECFNMKIISKDMDLINLSQFEELEITTYYCSKKYKELPSCDGQNLYFTDYSLMEKSNGSIEGWLGVEYFIDYYTNETWKIEYFEEMFMKEKFISIEELHKRFLEYGGK